MKLVVLFFSPILLGFVLQTILWLPDVVRETDEIFSTNSSKESSLFSFCWPSDYFFCHCPTGNNPVFVYNCGVEMEPAGPPMASKKMPSTLSSRRLRLPIGLLFNSTPGAINAAVRIRPISFPELPSTGIIIFFYIVLSYFGGHALPSIIKKN